MKAIVTGATGFIGQHLVDALALRGYDVVCLDRRPVRSVSPNVTRLVAHFGRGDLGLDAEVLAGSAVVFHLAGATKAVSRGDFTAANVALTDRLLTWTQRGSAPPRFVLVSSQAAAGPARDLASPKCETDPPAPIEDYGRSKLAAEQLVLSRSNRSAVTIVRPVAVYGPRDREFLHAFRLASRGLALYPGVRDSMLNVIYVHDLVRGIVAAAESFSAVGKTYFLGADEPVSWPELYEMIAAFAGHGKVAHVKVPRILMNLAGRAGDVIGDLSRKPLLLNSNKVRLATPRFWLCSSARARADFSFATPTPPEVGLRATYEWYAEHRWL